jgi:hypothetical protein
MKTATVPGIWVILFCGLPIIYTAMHHKPDTTTTPTAAKEAAVAPAPADCKTDWHLCADNSDLMNNWKG